LGDYTYHYDSDYLREQFDRLNGHKFLIEGNHDPAYVKNLPWDGVFKYQEIKYNKKVFVLFHYPILEWNGFHRNKDELVYIHLHGHIHSTPLDSKYPKIRGRMDVGVDANGFTPLSLDEVIRSVEY
jgi:calcineurin-like phosphoesterase family protein